MTTDSIAPHPHITLGADTPHPRITTDSDATHPRVITDAAITAPGGRTTEGRTPIRPGEWMEDEGARKLATIRTPFAGAHRCAPLPG